MLKQRKLYIIRRIYMEIECYLALRSQTESNNEYCPDVDLEIVDNYIFKYEEEYELSL